jgi:uncharacterized membrane protein
MTTTVRQFLQRQMTRQNKAGAILFMLTCPCHAVMLIFVLAGTAVGTWLAAIRAYLYLAFTLASLVGLWLMVRRATPSCAADACRREP